MKLRKSRLRQFFTLLQNTPFHPQWIIYKRAKKQKEYIGRTASGLIIDIGAGRQTVRPFLQENSQYIAIDYYDTSLNWYKHKPDLFADAQHLPLQSLKADTVLLLDVLEHLPRPTQAIAEIHRILKPQGILILSIPFLYPLHDEPLDFHRWTKYGIKQLAQQNDFKIKHLTITGEPAETAAMLYNIALCKAGLSWLQSKSMKSILLITYPLLLPLLNIMGWIVSKISPTDDFAPSGYMGILQKQNTKK